MSYSQMVNSWPMYLICGSILVFLAVMCVVMICKSITLSKSLEMDSQVIRRVIVSSATFTVLPAVSVLIGMIALSGTLGVPMAWLRLSVIGALQYELQVTDISLQALGYHGIADLTQMSASDFGTVALVMAVGIIGGLVCCIFFLKRYLNKVQGQSRKESSKPGFGAFATVAMFIGLCSAYFGAYIGDVVHNQNYLPLIIACISGVSMLVFEGLRHWKKWEWLDNFSVATSMLIGMVAAVFINL